HGEERDQRCHYVAARLDPGGDEPEAPGGEPDPELEGHQRGRDHDRDEGRASDEEALLAAGGVRRRLSVERVPTAGPPGPPRRVWWAGGPHARRTSPPTRRQSVGARGGPPAVGDRPRADSRADVPRGGDWGPRALARAALRRRAHAHRRRRAW